MAKLINTDHLRDYITQGANAMVDCQKNESLINTQK